MVNKQNSSIKDNNGENLVNVIQKKAIKYTSSAVLGVGIAKIISINSNRVDKFLFHDIGNFLNSSKYGFMYTSIPNWFLILCILGYGVIAGATVRKYVKEMKK